jgi:hypothetical protein
MLEKKIGRMKMLEGSKIHDITWAKRSDSRLHYSHLLGASSTPLEKKRQLDSPVICLDPFPSIISIASPCTHEFLKHRYLKLWACVIVAKSQALMLLILLSSCGVHPKILFYFYFFQWATLFGPLEGNYWKFGQLEHHMPIVEWDEWFVWPLYIGYESSTLGKAYGINPSPIKNILWNAWIGNLVNILGTHWKHVVNIENLGNMLGTSCETHVELNENTF